MSNRHKNRNRPHQQSPGQGKGQGPSGSAWWPPPAASPPLPTGDLPHVSIGDGDQASASAIGADGDLGAKPGYQNSRGNACTHGMRSSVVFPAQMAERIDATLLALIEEMKPNSTYEDFLVGEIAKSMVQVDAGGRRLLLDRKRLIDRASGPEWDADANARVDRLLARLLTRPELTVRALEASKQGALFLISRFKGLGDIVQTNNSLDEAQRDSFFDCLGVPHPLRNGSKVPAGNDGPGLSALITHHIARLETSLERTLNNRDQADQRMAMLGISGYKDSATRSLKSEEAQAHKRLIWATSAIQRLRNGSDPSTIIDPKTQNPIDPGAAKAPAANRARSATPPPPPLQPPPQPPRPTARSAEDSPPAPPVDLPPISEGCSAELRESLLIVAGLVAERKAASREAPAEPGPPPV